MSFSYGQEGQSHDVTSTLGFFTMVEENFGILSVEFLHSGWFFIGSPFENFQNDCIWPMPLASFFTVGKQD